MIRKDTIMTISFKVPNDPTILRIVSKALLEIADTIVDAPDVAVDVPVETVDTPVAPVAPVETVDTPVAPVAPDVAVDVPDTPVAPDVDARGMTYDTRIHSASKNLNKDGTWRYKRGVDKALIESVEAELNAPVAAPAAPAAPVAAPAAPVAAPAAPAAPVAAPAAPVAATTGPDLTPTVPAPIWPEAAPTISQELLSNVIMPNVNTKWLTALDVNNLLQANGFSHINELVDQAMVTTMYNAVVSFLMEKAGG
jgi:hypothetical protein